MNKKYKVFRLRKVSRGFEKITVSLYATLDEAKRRIDEAREEGQHLCVEIV